MRRGERVRRYALRQIVELKKEIWEIRNQASSTMYEDLRTGLLQRAGDLDAERLQLEQIVEAIPTPKGE
ncbi:MAG: hypothetical protein K9L66_04990 [Spirochaetaceae bacterium]|nr:hypothetical protein [Spirochaetaceae bacterium]MCF7948530.1 hypothetical protein [Spirochaetia bacterium]MCF7951008.1 hypothetical protein [Spirochaetaceae bacterium]